MKNVLREIHRRSLWQVLGIYVAASWLVLQVIDLMSQNFELPAWLMPLAIALLLIGLPIILATAFVQKGVGRAVGPAARPFADPERPASGVEGAPSPEPAGAPVAAEPEGAHQRILTWRNALLGGAGALLLLFGLTGLYIIIQDRGETLAPSEAIADEAALPGIAVLPFTVTGGMDDWREAMVELLSTNLDGTGGLRAIDSRTVMARWREEVGDGQTADLATQLAVARASGASFMVTGSVVALGPEVRLGAEIYDVGTGAELDQTQVQGHPDSVFTLVDELTIETLGAILRDDLSELPSVDLARTTTSSLPALRAYLEGAAVYRESEFELAVSAFERALQADSTFALAAYRLSDAYGWSESILSELGQGAIDQAARHADRLPEREAVLVRATRALLHGDHRGIQPLQTLVRRYPDDVEAWYLLGDMYMHLGEDAMIDLEEAEAAFLRAIDLDPTFSPAHIHYVDFAFVRPDSAEAATRLAEYGRLATGSEPHRQLESAFALAFGDEATRSRAEAALDTASISLTAIAVQNLWHPRFADTQPATAAAIDRSGHAFGGIFLFYADFHRGRPVASMEPALRSGNPPFAGVEAAFLIHSLTPLVPEEGLPHEQIDSVLAWSSIDTTSALDVFYAGAYAADRSREADAATAIRVMGDISDRLLAEGDTAVATFAAGAVQALDGFRVANGGDLERAVPLLQEARGSMIGNYPYFLPGLFTRWRIGRLLARLDRHDEAAPYLASAYIMAPMRLELARAYEETGDFDKAREAYREFIAAWHGAEEALQPLVEEATQALLRLTDALQTEGTAP